MIEVYVRCTFFIIIIITCIGQICSRPIVAQLVVSVSDAGKFDTFFFKYQYLNRNKQKNTYLILLVIHRYMESFLCEPLLLFLPPPFFVVIAVFVVVRAVVFCAFLLHVPLISIKQQTNKQLKNGVWIFFFKDISCCAENKFCQQNFEAFTFVYFTKI